MTYRVEPNHCTCHPETCCCNPWRAVDGKGEKYASYFRRGDAEHAVNVLNENASLKAELASLEKQIKELRK